MTYYEKYIKYKKLYKKLINNESKINYDKTEINYDKTEINYDKIKRSHDKIKRSHDKTKRNHDKPEINHDKTEMNHDKTKRSHDKTKRSHDKTKNIFKYYHNDLADIGKKCGTDKISHHGYHRFYPRYIEKYRNKHGSMLEIGIQNKYSVNLWLEYFPKAFIYGIDINFTDSEKRYEIFKADQSSLSDLENVKNKINKQLFFIIDDGSHIPEHQVLTFNYFFNTLLEPGGTYIIEDIETSYWTKNGLYSYPTNYGYHHPKSTVELFKILIDDINDEYLKNENKNTQTLLLDKYIDKITRQKISSITFAQNCIIIVKKTENEERIYNNRSYVFKKNL